MLSTFSRLFLACAALLSVGIPVYAQPSAADAPARQLWQQLDYVGVDYGGAVSHGQVVSQSEYAEMREFAANALRQARALPPRTELPPLLAAIETLQRAVERKAEAEDVAKLARHASDLLLAAYPMPVAPKELPDLQRGAALYRAQCAGCHGATGHSDGPLAAQLDPKPVAFADRGRAQSRSLLALYQVVSQGVSGTPMPSFGSLPEADRWALAFFVGTLSHDSAMRERGETAWRRDAAAKAQFPDVAALTTATEAGVAGKLGAEEARDVTAYLRSRPQALSEGKPTGVALSRALLKDSLAAARSGDAQGATRLALAAYLDGFEPIEPTLAARNKPLMTEVETQMLAYRAALSAANIAEAEAVAKKLDATFSRVDAELGSGAVDPATTFVGSLTILLREGVEALLIVVGMLAFLRKAERRDVIGHVHAGWIAALAAGLGTWAVATYIVSISGANREVTEGVSSLFAAVVLLGVGLWMHQKSSAGRWQAYLKTKLSAAMTRRSAWGLFALSFIAVYREVFETVLFYSALSADGNGMALVAGLAVGVATLGLIGWMLMRTSSRMPIGKFFSISSVLVAVLAFVLAGKGVAGLQEAGWLSASPIGLPRIEILGIFPSAETLTAQVVVLLIAAAGFGYNAVSGRRVASAARP